MRRSSIRAIPRSGNTPMLATATIATKAVMIGGSSGGRALASAPGRPLAYRRSRRPAGRAASRASASRDRRGERDSAGRGRCRDDLGHVVDARADPGADCSSSSPSGAERRPRPSRACRRRHERDGERDLVLVGVDDAVRRRDRRDTADREAVATRSEGRPRCRAAARPTRAEERDRDDRDDDEQRLEPERADVGEDESRPSRTTPSLSTGPAATCRPSRLPRERRAVRERACRARRRARAAAGRERVGGERDGDPDPRESEAGAARCLIRPAAGTDSGSPSAARTSP